MKMTTTYIRSIAVYIAITFGGLISDIGLSSALVYIVHLPLLVAGLCGLLTHAIIDYFISLKITFKDRQLSATWGGLRKYLRSFALSTLIRLVALTLLGWFSNFSSIVSLLIAVGLSSSLHSILSRFYVFRQKSQ